ncbi:unnamed protein product [Closterium sp. NIES-65]|nr:unnamed protein product [Closterium sp. NIES-65]
MARPVDRAVVQPVTCIAGPTRPSPVVPPARCPAAAALATTTYARALVAPYPPRAYPVPMPVLSARVPRARAVRTRLCPTRFTHAVRTRLCPTRFTRASRASHAAPMPLCCPCAPVLPPVFPCCPRVPVLFPCSHAAPVFPCCPRAAPFCLCRVRFGAPVSCPALPVLPRSARVAPFSPCPAPFSPCPAPFSPCPAPLCPCCPVQPMSCPVLPVLPRSACLCPTRAVRTRSCPTRAVSSRSCPTRSVLPGLVLPITPVRPVPYST